MQYYNSFNGPSRPSSYSHTVAQHNFGASSMQNYHLARPTWTPAEDALAVWLLSRDFNIPDVSRIMQCRLQRPIHSDIAFMNRLEKINMDQARRHLPPLCTHGLANWDRTVVDDYLFRLTSNSDGLESLLWFHERSYIPLLRTVRSQMAYHDTLFTNDNIVA